MVPLPTSDQQTHNETYHTVDDPNEEDLPADYISPYRFLRLNKMYVCVIGCEFKTENQLDIRKHMVDCHNDEECEKWGYSRDLLYSEFLKQQQVESGYKEDFFLGKRLHVPIDDDDCDFKRRVCF